MACMAVQAALLRFGSLTMNYYNSDVVQPYAFNSHPFIIVHTLQSVNSLDISRNGPYIHVGGQLAFFFKWMFKQVTIYW